MSLIYYSRIRFILNLMPLLLAAPQSAHVVSVYAAGLEAKLFKDDLSLRNPKNYSLINARSHNAYMTTMAFEHLAKQYQQLSFVHAFPGIVVTPSYTDPGFPWWFKLLWRLFGPLIRRFQAISAEDSGSRTLFLGTSRFASQRGLNSANKPAEGVAKGTNGTLGSGAYAVGADSETVTSKADLQALRNEGFEGAVWEHTIQAFDAITAGRDFVG